MYQLHAGLYPHLLKADETFGIRLTSYHNLYFLVNLMKKVRQAIMDDNLLEFREDFIERYGYNNPAEISKSLHLKGQAMSDEEKLLKI